VSLHQAGRRLVRWADPVSWGAWQLAAFIGLVALLSVVAFRAVGG
jgi:hypothetical protein